MAQIEKIMAEGTGPGPESRDNSIPLPDYSLPPDRNRFSFLDKARGALDAARRLGGSNPGSRSEPPQHAQPNQTEQPPEDGLDVVEEGASRPVQATPEPATANVGGSPPEPPRSETSITPEPNRGPEWETSPERGRWLVEQIVEMETTLPYEDRYNVENGPKLNRLYKELQKYAETVCKGRNTKNPFDIKKDHPNASPTSGQPLIEAIVQAYENQIQREVAPSNNEPEYKPEDFTGTEDLDSLIAKYESRKTPTAELAKAEEELLKYFREAKRKGLLKGVDDILDSIYKGYATGAYSIDKFREVLKQSIIVSASNDRPIAIIAAEAAFTDLRRDDPEMVRLADVWLPYLKFAGERFERFLTGREQREYREGEWRFPVQEEEQGTAEIFWEPSPNYPKYYHITAKTPRQFRIAKETFLHMIKDYSLGYAPDELMQHLLNFKDMLSAEGRRLVDLQAGIPDGPEKMTAEFMRDLRQEYEGQAFLWGADYNNEHYNKDGYKQYSTAMALHEGPQRWIRVARSGNGQVGAFTWHLDNNPLIELAYNAQGSRGQLGGYVVAQNYLRQQIMEMMVERGMGVVLKDYDPRDVANLDSRVRLSRAILLDRIEKQLKRSNYNLEKLSEEDRELYLASTGQLRANQECIGAHQSIETFKSLYEGFDDGSANIRDYQLFKGYDEDKLPFRLKRSVALGRVQQAITDLRAEVRKGKVNLKKGENLIDKLVSLKRISKQDKKLYKEAFEIAKANFDIAMQMQGVTQEKTVRGGGVYFVYRNTHIQTYLKYRIDGTDNLSSDVKSSYKKGRILHDISMGKNPNTLNADDLQVYQQLTEAEKTVFVDHVPVHLARKAVTAAINWVKMKYADDQEIWRRPGFVERLKDKDSEGNHANYRARYRALMVNRAIQMATDQIVANGYEAKFFDEEFGADYVDYFDKDGNLNKDKTEPKPIKTSPMVLKRPRIFGYTASGRPVIEFDERGKPVGLSETDFDESDKAVIYNKPEGDDRKRVDITNLVSGNSLTRRDDGVFVQIEEKDVDFSTAVDSYLALHTTHTYWAYQNNNTHTLIPEYVFDQARQIREGKLRQEDADILAGLLLTLDPTLCRVRGFPGEQMSVESMVFDAAVEESYLGWIDGVKVLNKRFLPQDGNPEYMNMGYYIEDWGGEGRFTMMIENLVAKMPKRWARRLSADLANSPMYISTMADNLGRKGVLGAVSMMEDRIHEISDQRILGQFGLTKFINMLDAGSKLWFALVGGTDPQTGLHHEGLFMKPTNNSDKLVKWLGKGDQITLKREDENAFFYDLLANFGRVEATLKQIRTLYSDVRNAGGALDLRKTDVFLPDGRYNPEINKDRNTGSSRHIAKMFWDAYVDWLLDPGPGGGVEAYGSEASYYKFLRQPIIFDVLNKKQDPRTLADWLFDKMAL